MAIDSAPFSAGIKPPEGEIEYTDGIRELPVTTLPSPAGNPTLTGPVTGISLGTEEPRELPTSLPIGLPYTSNDVEATDDLDLLFDLGNCGVGSQLFITCSVEVSRGSYTETATVVDYQGNELIVQSYRPDVLLPETPVETTSSYGGEARYSTVSTTAACQGA